MKSYSFKDGKEAQSKVDILTKIHFGEKIFHRLGPMKVVIKIVGSVSINGTMNVSMEG